jgi:acyl-CoA synthetase (AMP-forming)/AMP-acid ligase II
MPGAEIEILADHGSRQSGVLRASLSLPHADPGWRRYFEASTNMPPGGHLHMGDVAIRDTDGWVYLVDRIEDRIRTSGQIVGRDEVEGVLYERPAVLEAAVVRGPDDCRGETVVVYVSLRYNGDGERFGAPYFENAPERSPDVVPEPTFGVRMPWTISVGCTAMRCADARIPRGRSEEGSDK